MGMDKYEYLCVVGEGAYGKVLKCKHRDTGQIVAIKRFLETEDDRIIRKVALREIRVLKKLKHDNLVSMIEVFRRRKRFFLVFEFICKTLLNELEENGSLSEERTKRYTFQILRGLEFIHENNIVHRDIKPENILVTKAGVIKLCDFGFARFVTFAGEPYTDYVATRWYRAPELLVGDTNYGRPVDIWATGCIVLEMLTGEPLFAGSSDLDQIFCIINLLGDLTEEQLMQAQKCMTHFPLTFSKKQNDLYYITINKGSEFTHLRDAFPTINKLTIEMAACCLTINPNIRLTAPQLLEHRYFKRDNFSETFSLDLQKLIQEESKENPLLINSTSSKTNQGPCGTRRKSISMVSEWHISIPDYEKKELPTFVQSKGHDENTQQKVFGKEPNRAPHLPQTSNGAHNDEGNLLFDGSTGKIPMPYKKDMLPNTQTIRVAKGHLVFDKNQTLPLNINSQSRRYICEDVSLPDIQKVFEVKKKKQELIEMQLPLNTKKPKSMKALQIKQPKMRRRTLDPN